MRILSVVWSGKDYHGLAEYEKPINMYPHYQTVRLVAKAQTIEDVVEIFKTEIIKRMPK